MKKHKLLKGFLVGTIILAFIFSVFAPQLFAIDLRSRVHLALCLLSVLLVITSTLAFVLIEMLTN